MGKRQNKFNTEYESVENQKKIATTKGKYTLHDLKLFQPKTGAQARFVESYDHGTEIIINKGVPGSGKDFIAICKALQSILSDDSHYERLIIIRSAVAVRDQGFLPADLESKEAVYETPYRQLIDEMFKSYNTVYDNLKSLDKVRFMSTSYLRGITLPENSIVLIDEIQNFDYSEFCTAFSRVGENSRIIMTGDSGQTDIGRRNKEKSGFDKFMRILHHMQKRSIENKDERDLVEIIDYAPSDIVRSGIVREFYISQYELDEVE